MNAISVYLIDDGDSYCSNKAKRWDQYILDMNNKMILAMSAVVANKKRY